MPVKQSGIRKEGVRRGGAPYLAKLGSRGTARGANWKLLHLLDAACEPDIVQRGVSGKSQSTKGNNCSRSCSH